MPSSGEKNRAANSTDTGASPKSVEAGHHRPEHQRRLLEEHLAIEHRHDPIGRPETSRRAHERMSASSMSHSAVDPRLVKKITPAAATIQSWYCRLCRTRLLLSCRPLHAKGTARREPVPVFHTRLRLYSRSSGRPSQHQFPLMLQARPTSPETTVAPAVCGRCRRPRCRSICRSRGNSISGKGRPSGDEPKGREEADFLHVCLASLDMFEPYGHGLGVLLVVVLIHQLDPTRRRSIVRYLLCAHGRRRRGRLAKNTRDPHPAQRFRS